MVKYWAFWSPEPLTITPIARPSPRRWLSFSGTTVLYNCITFCNFVVIVASLKLIMKKKLWDTLPKSLATLTSPSWQNANPECTSINARQTSYTTLITSEGAGTWVTTTYAVQAWMEPFCIMVTLLNPIRKRSTTMICGKELRSMGIPVAVCVAVALDSFINSIIAELRMCTLNRLSPFNFLK